MKYVIILISIFLQNCTYPMYKLNENKYKLYNAKNVPNEKVYALDLSDGQFQRSEMISKYSDLVYLNISNNQLENFPEEICKLKKLKVLNISQNDFEELPECFYMMKNMESLICFDCSISNVGDKFSSLNLKTFFYGENTFNLKTFKI